MKIGIIGAMDYEAALLVEQMTAETQREIAGTLYHEGELNGVSVVVVVSGIGKVNAALCAQILISEFSVTHVINTGVSGAVKDFLNVGDIVISTDLMEHDFDVTGFGGYQHGQIPRMETSVFVADLNLRNLALEASRQLITDHNVYEGRIVSGDQFVASLEKKDFLLETFDATTTEMEGAAIGHVCYLNQKPFVIIRAMSDKADGSAHVNFETFSKAAAINAANIVMKMLEALS